MEEAEEPAEKCRRAARARPTSVRPLGPPLTGRQRGQRQEEGGGGQGRGLQLWGHSEGGRVPPMLDFSRRLAHGVRCRPTPSLPPPIRARGRLFVTWDSRRRRNAAAAALAAVAGATCSWRRGSSAG
ncbi:hypothetical protein HPB50_010320 [Hyalomma asiaticum]|uniref:Uncharacterized protein n=1 Tax=Hyalomma asiaticum TaxID=266040 RepID=A0ACB7TFR2_HYAAI|nr:hypothetical protein HPB50_010320 [Hyalomma asiaticum]